MQVLDTQTHVLTNLIADLNARPVRTNIAKVHEQVFQMGHREEKPATRRQAAQLRAFLPEADISRGFQETVVNHTLTGAGIHTDIDVPQSLSHCVVSDGTYRWDIDVRVDVMGALARLSGDDQLVLAVNAADRDTVEPRITFNRTLSNLLGQVHHGGGGMLTTAYFEGDMRLSSHPLLGTIRSVFATADAFLEVPGNRELVMARAAAAANDQLAHIHQVIKANGGRAVLAYDSHRVLFEAPRTAALAAIGSWIEGHRTVIIRQVS
jgi:hypothetical protein